MVDAVFRVGFAPGVTVDKWVRIWPERVRSVRLEVVPLADDALVPALHAGEVEMAFVRLPIDRTDLHCIPLYDDIQVVVAAREHPVAAYDEVPLEDLADEHQVPADVGAAMAIETVAAGTGVVIVPLSVARLHHRKDVVHRPVLGLEPSKVGLAWPIASENTLNEMFIGIVRGRSARSSRG